MIQLIKNYIRPYTKNCILGALAKLVEAILELVSPILMAKIINFGIPNKDKSYIIQMGLSILLISTLGVISALYCQYSASVACVGIGGNIRLAIVKKINTFSYKNLDKFGTNTLNNILTSDINYIQDAIAKCIRLLSRTPFLCIGAIIMSFTINVQLTLIFLIMIPLISVVLIILMRLTSKLYSLSRKKLDELTLIINENLTGIKSIRSFRKFSFEKNKVSNKSIDLEISNNKVVFFSSLTSPLTSLIVNIGIIAVLYFGAIKVYNGHLLAGDILALSTYATKILNSLIVTANLINVFPKAFTASVRVNEILNEEPDLKFYDETKNIKTKNNDFTIEFKNVSFNLLENKILKDINFKLRKGETLGIIGVTGSGKTTLINLLQRFYDVTDGEILLYGNNIKNYSKKDLRNKFSIVQQKSILLSDTIKDNLTLGNKNVSEEEIISALKNADAFDFVIEKENNLNYKISEGANSFSGGQKQRLNLSRGFLKKAPILILDDSLSALDYKTDKKIMNNIKNNINNENLIIISQRVSSIMGADKILVLSETGDLVNIGSHDYLLKNCDIYKNIFNSQINLK